MSDVGQYLLLGGALLAVFAVLRLPGFKARNPQAVVLRTNETPWQVVLRDVRQVLKIVVLAVLAGSALALYLIGRGII